MRRKYIKPESIVVQVDMAAVICHSYSDSEAGGTTPGFDAPRYRDSRWDEYEQK